MAKEFIRVVGARQHNLKNLTVEIPRDRLVVITGPSGSGKSSLAFDTLFAEGQRKYVESLSVYARQFLDQLEKPEVEHIEGLSPAIAIEQRSSAANPRSTIATTTEIYDYLRLLYANVGQPHDPESGRVLTRKTTPEIADTLLALPAQTRLMLLAPVVDAQKGEFRDVLERLAREGFVRARVDGQLTELVANKPQRLDASAQRQIEVVVDRLVIAEGVRTRLVDSLETALKWGQGRIICLHQLPGAAKIAKVPPRETVASLPVAWIETPHSTRLVSPVTGKTYEPPTAQHFSFNSPRGACPVCHGLGQKRVFDAALIVPDETRALEDGAVHPYRRLGGKRMVTYYKGLIKGVAGHYGVPLDRPWKELPAAFKTKLLQGTGADEIEFWFMHAGAPRKTRKAFEGVIPNLERLYAESESEFTRNRLKAYMTLAPCDACGGKRLRPELLAVTLPGAVKSPVSPGKEPTIPAGSAVPIKIPGVNIADFCAQPIGAAERVSRHININPPSTTDCR